MKTLNEEEKLVPLFWVEEVNDVYFFVFKSNSLIVIVEIQINVCIYIYMYNKIFKYILTILKDKNA